MSAGFSASARPSTYTAGALALDLHPDTVSWIARATVKPSWAQIFAVDDLIDADVQSGAWGSRIAVYAPVYAPDATTACLNLKGPNYTLTNHGGQFIPGQGIKNDGVASYQDCGFDLSLLPFSPYTANSCSLMEWVLTDLPGPTYLTGSGSGSTQMLLRARNSASASTKCNTQSSDIFKNATGIGLLGFSRQQAASYFAYKSGAVLTFARPSTGIPVGPVYIGRFGNTYDPNLWSIWECGGGRSVSQCDGFYYAGLSGQILVGAITNDDPPPQEVVGPSELDQSYLALTDPPGLIIERANPPPDTDLIDKTAYTGFPVSRCLYGPGDMATGTTVNAWTSTWTGGQIGLRMWTYGAVNRIGGKPNVEAPTLYHPNGLSCRSEWSTSATATAALVAQAMDQMGCALRNEPAHPQGYGVLDVLQQAGFAVSDSLTTGQALSYLTVASAPAAYYAVQDGSYMVCTDLWRRLPLRICDCSTGVGKKVLQLDWEPNDFRSGAQALAAIQVLKTIAAAKNFVLSLYCDPMGGSGALAAGLVQDINPLTGNPYILDIYNTVDELGGVINQTPAGSAGASMAAQIDFIGADDMSRFFPICSIGTPDQYLMPADAQAISAAVIENRMKMVDIFPRQGQQGGAKSRYYNQAVLGVSGIPL